MWEEVYGEDFINEIAVDIFREKKYISILVYQMP